MYRTKTGKVIDFKGAKEIAAGGEGRILEHPLNKNQVVKIYHQPRQAKFTKHLELLSKLGTSFVKPNEIYHGPTGKVDGFSMDYVNFNDYWLFNNLFNKGFCTANKIDANFKVKVLIQLKAAVEFVHAQGIVIGDLNQYNLFVSKKAGILFVDVDSFASSQQPHSGVLLDDIRDWTTLNINSATDSWAYDILAFWATTFCHPFRWVAPGNTDSLEQRVKMGKSFLTKIAGIKIPALYQPPMGSVLSQFKEIFSGRRYMIDFGHTAPTVSPLLVKQSVFSASVTIRELYSHVLKVNCAENFIAFQSVGYEWTLVETAISHVTRELLTKKCDELYPTQGKEYAWRDGNDLQSSAGYSRHFRRPEFFYVNGLLSVTDYSDDIQYNFDLQNQMGDIDCTSIPVFAKSIIIRDAPIQNFGAKKYLNLPLNNRYMMIEVPLGTKNAYFCAGYYIIECLQKNRVNYTLTAPNKDIITLDYLPYFTVKNGMIFIPDNGHIDIYKGGQVIATLDVSNCTRDSKLYNTTSGIIMLEGATLYLLNTKN